MHVPYYTAVDNVTCTRSVPQLWMIHLKQYVIVVVIVIITIIIIIIIIIIIAIITVIFIIIIPIIVMLLTQTWVLRQFIFNWLSSHFP